MWADPPTAVRFRVKYAQIVMYYCRNSGHKFRNFFFEVFSYHNTIWDPGLEVKTILFFSNIEIFVGFLARKPDAEIHSTSGMKAQRFFNAMNNNKE